MTYRFLRLPSAMTQRSLAGLLAIQAVITYSSQIKAQPQQSTDSVRRVEPVDISQFPRPRPFSDRPPVPVRVLPQDDVEPPRSVRAHEWRSPYCTEWTDGQEICERVNATVPATCRQIPSAVAAPKRHPVACLSADLDRLPLICWRDAVMDPGEPIPYWRNRWEKQNSSGILVQHNWFWDAEVKAWLGSAAWDDAIGNHPQTFLPLKGIRAEVANLRTFYCLRTFEEPIPWHDLSPGRLH